jgi:autotransporter-associated beta strand protein
VALRYFDRNGTTAGFGTLTGAWDTTTASWSTSAAGTATPATFTFGSADEAQFGATGATATAGTATIATSLDVTVNAVRTQNLAGIQLIAANTGGKLTLAGTTPTIDSQSGLRITSDIAGTGGFTKSGAGTLVLEGAKAVSGQVTVAAGFLQLGAATGTADILGSVSDFVLTGSLLIQGNSSFTFATPFAGTGGVRVGINGTATISDTSSIAGFAGTVRVIADPSFSTAPIAAWADLPLAATTIGTENYMAAASGTASTATHRFTHGRTSISTPVQLFTNNDYDNGVSVIEDNGSDPCEWSGKVFVGISTNAGAIQTLRLAGSNTSTWSGNITQEVLDGSSERGTVALSKAGAGQWNLTGTNTYKGTTIISAGTLSAQNASALGRDSSLSGGAISVTGGTLELAGGITLDKSGLNISTVTTASPTNAFQVPADGDDNTLEVGSITLNSTILVDVGSSAALRFANTGAITGSTFGITKNGTGELDMGATANSFTGAFTFNAGTLTVAASVVASTNGPLGNSSSTVTVPSTGTLKFDGASNSNFSRAVQLQGSTPALEASGTGHIHFSNVSQAAGSRTLTLKGTSTTNNQLQSALADGSGGTTGLTKDGAGKWSVTGTPSYTGLTTVNAGTLDFAGQDLTLTGDVAMAGGVLANGTLDNTLVTDVTFTGGTVQALLDGASTVTASSGTGRLYPVTSDGSNTYSGTTTVQAGATLELVTDFNPGTVGYGKVTGAGNVTVSGTLATGNDVNQRGQARYGGNLTFAAGSVLAIGAAA